MPDTTPALSPPTGTTSNFINPQSLAYWSDVTIGICVPLASIFFFLRSYVRIRYRRTWVLEDWLVLTSWIGTVAFCGVTSATMAHHGGEHLWDMTPTQAQGPAYWFNVATTLYAVTICIVKIAILWLYRRVFSPRKGSSFEIMVFVLIAILSAFYGATALAKIFECSPRSKIVDDTIPGTCLNIYAILIADGIFNTITDFMILFMPSLIVYRLKINHKKKLFILMVFTFGLCAPAFGIIGTYYRILWGGSPDISWYRPAILLWRAAEVTTGIMCVCIPEFGLLFKKQRRSDTRPTASILQGAKTAIARTRERARQKAFAGQLDTDNEMEPMGASTYLKLDEEIGHRTNVCSATTGETGETGEVPKGSVHVRYDLHVESE